MKLRNILAIALVAAAFTTNALFCVASPAPSLSDALDILRKIAECFACYGAIVIVLLLSALGLAGRSFHQHDFQGVQDGK